MLRIRGGGGDPHLPKAGPVFEKHSISPVLGDNRPLVVNDPVAGNLPTCLSYPQTVSSHPHHGVNSEDSQIFHWLQAGTLNLKELDLDDMANKKSVPAGEIMGDDHGYWSEQFASFDSDPSKAQLYAQRSRSAPQSHESLTHPIRENPVIRMHSRLEVPDASSSDLNRSSFTHYVPAPNHVTHGLAQPTPRPPGLFMMTQYLTPYAGFRPESTALTPLSTPDVMHDEPQADENPLHGPIPASNPMITGTLYQRSSEESSIGTADSDFTSIGSTCGPTTPLPWSIFTVQPQWDLHCQENARNDTTTWLGAPPHVHNIPHVYGHSSTEAELGPFAPNDLPGLSEPGAGPQRYVAPSIPLDLCRPGYPLREQDIDNQGLGAFPMSPNNPSTCISTAHRIMNQYIIPTAAVLGDDHPLELERPEKTTPCHRDTKNAFLIECKRRGLSYKDIKRIGGFKEAESTLRGRFRTLTKAKEQRVRKPQWLEKDVCLSFFPISRSPQAISHG